MSSLPESLERETPVDRPREVSAEAERYAGLVTRVISFALDAAVINLVAIIVAIGASLVLSLLHLPKDVKTILTAIAGAVYILWTIGYFVFFWSTTGQTPGARVMQIRVITSLGGRLKPRRSIVRCFGVVLAALPLFAGFLPILYTRRRRGFQDWLARTLVVDAPAPSAMAVRQVARREVYEASRRRPPPSPPSGDGRGGPPADRPLST
jgi:uncharacterized RDD family membrane protein YckC